MRGKKLLGVAALAAGIVSVAGSGALAQTPTGPNQQPKPFQPCTEVPAYQEQKKAQFDKLAKAQEKGIALTWDQQRLTDKFARYDKAMCGDDGYPHLITDGRLSNAGDFLIPGLLFLYIAGALGWAGRSYLAQSSGAEDEIIIDLPKAIRCLALSFIWPVQALPEILSGKIRESEERVTVSPR
jgi:photosystem I subunit 3